MPTVYETGHAKNLANFETLITYVKGYGANYNPSNVAIQLVSLQNQANEARTALDQVNNLQAAYSNAVADRTVAFDPLKKLSTRLVNALKATGATKAIIESAETNNRKLQGSRASAKLSEEEKQSLLAAGKTVNQISTSQMSFDSKLDSFDKQIKLLQSIPAYSPNETELQISTLIGLYDELLKKNRAVTEAESAISTGRIARDKIFYNNETGMGAIATDVKNYVKSVYGAGAAAFKQISGLQFRTIKR
ncbi:hypothetical protein [Pedobacter sandarakinus]|uniref:hypothetical protein n=1 Tax=Pedobacter sandarakinus TaxID=353156 RepID=UPI0022456569|nr:hypothetical protein [Pedobacter sandarakinus]MCX2575066.1 hypothetical protein [Pedobacter sandarakinus]